MPNPSEPRTGDAEGMESWENHVMVIVLILSKMGVEEASSAIVLLFDREFPREREAKRAVVTRRYPRRRSPMRKAHPIQLPK